MKNKTLGTLALLGVLVVVSGAGAGITREPTSYDMPNGYSGTYNYWDDSYTGAGSKTTNGAWLSGGLGDLTDGVVAADNWYAVEGPLGPHGPYVGWVNVNPVIQFNFDQAYAFETVRIHFDDADGYGGVSAPGGVVVNGTSYGIADPLGSAPFWATLDVSGQSLVTNTLTIQLNRRNSWVFASEFDFISPGNPVPAPGALLLGSLGTLGAAILRRRRGL